ncbi:DUF4515 domain-containing protein [Marinobacterium stanieri]|uniref:DUF4515 domain-containing protein n=1 Tax=Marinobacterium stanieri TaxID=49186 RepID=UPI000255A8BA|nr:DUF4515 domain-containing protein [Marinobacterium stanieri]
MSNPKSIEYLERENANFLERVEELKERLRNLEELLKKERESSGEYARRLEQLNKSLIEKGELVSNLKKQLEKLKNMGMLRFLWFKLTRR